MTVRVSLDRFLERNNLTAYKLTKEVGGKASQGSIYALSRGNKVKRVDLETLSEVMGALSRLTGQPVTPNDLLEIIETPTEMDSDTKTWLDASAADALEQLQALEQDQAPEAVAAWLEAFHTAGTPVKFNQRTRKFTGQQ